MWIDSCFSEDSVVSPSPEFPQDIVEQLRAQLVWHCES